MTNPLVLGELRGALLGSGTSQWWPTAEAHCFAPAFDLAAPSPRVRAAFVAGLDASEEVCRFVADPSPSVRWTVAEHRSVSPAALLVLADDPDVRVRLTVVAHPVTPTAALLRLVCDTNAEVRIRAVAHPNATAETKALAWAVG